MDANLETLEETEGTGSAQNGQAEEASQGHNVAWEEEKEELSDISYNITSYGADYTVDGIVRRYRQGDIFVPDFQRKPVWTWTQSSRFIESLLLGLPVPGIFLYKKKIQKGCKSLMDNRESYLLRDFILKKNLRHTNQNLKHINLKVIMDILLISTIIVLSKSFVEN